MLKSGRHSLPISTISLILVVCLAVRPTMNARDSAELFKDPGADFHAESLFHSATDLIHLLHDRPLDSRAALDYRRAVEACNQVVKLGSDSRLSAESLARAAELTREMADVSGDNYLYRQSIETYRRIVAHYPDSNLVGAALVSIAQIFEENIQDLDGSAAAYAEIIRRFPSSVMAREARAVLSRIQAQLEEHGQAADVLVPNGASADHFGSVRLSNVRSFTGADYARVVLDLSGEASYSQRRLGPDRIAIRLSDTHVARSLEARRLIIAQPKLLSRIRVSQGADGIEIELKVASIADYSVFNISNPERLIIDIHSGHPPAPRIQPERVSHEALTDRYEPRRQAIPGAPRSTLSLPEITEPIVTRDETAVPSQSGASPDGLPIKCIVIDPGHGGHDTGTIGAGGLREKDLVLDVARRLRAYIKRDFPGFEVVLTRDSDRFVALEERTAIANSRRADLFISIHANASLSRIASGVETFFVSPDRAAQLPPRGEQEHARDKTSENPNDNAASDAAAGETPTKRPEPVYASVSVGNRIAASRDLARYIQAGLVRGIGSASPRTATNRGVKHAPFAVLVGSAMPSVLAEVSFMSNRRDENLLSTSQFRERIAASLFAGLKAYLKRTVPLQAQPKK